jgi:regulator of sigma E protease
MLRVAAVAAVVLAAKAVGVKGLAAVALVGILIFIHESGHFLFAKLFGVGVKVFSLGFGRRLFGIVYKGTDYRVSLLPAGGYVMMEGADPFQDGGEGQSDPDSKTAFMNKPVWQRLIIVAAGPVFNLILPVLVFGGLYMYGQPEIGTWVGGVRIDSPAWEAGLRPGDKILEVQGTDVTLWAELYEPIDAAGDEVTFEVEGKGPLTVDLPEGFVAAVDFDSIGMSHEFVRSRIGVTDPDSPAGKMGLLTGDVVDSVNGVEVSTWFEMRPLLSAESLALTYRRADPDSDEVIEGEVTLVPGDWAPTVIEGDVHANVWGLVPGDTVVFTVSEDSAAELSGLRSGDRVVALDGETVHSWDDVIRHVGAAKEGEGIDARTLPIDFTLEREGRQVDLRVVPNMVEDTNRFGEYRIRPLAGFGTYADYTHPEVVHHRYGFVDALGKGVDDTLYITGRVVTTVGKLITGEAAPSKTLGGPIQIFRDAASAAEGGIVTYCNMLAALSISLGVVNFLPVPVLDGGQFLFYLLEGIRGRPLSLRVRERAQQIGVLFLVGLMFAVLVMDVNRWIGG